MSSQEKTKKPRLPNSKARNAAHRIARLYRIFSEQEVGVGNPTLNLAMNEFAELAADAEAALKHDAQL